MPLSTLERVVKITIAIFVLFMSEISLHEAKAQAWPKIYNSGLEDYAVEVIQTYDIGFAILGYYILGSGVKRSWIIKTDVNGSILWERSIYGNTGNKPFGIAETPDGGLVVVGLTYEANVQYDPFIVKFDACGEKEWCTIFPAPWGLASPFDVAVDSAGYILMLVNQYAILPDWAVHIFKLKPDGSILYMKPFVSNQIYASNTVSGRRIQILQNGDYLITGKVYWENPWGPTGVVYIRGLLARIKPYGVEDWVLPISLPDTVYGAAFETIELNNGDLLTTADFWYSQALIDPMFVLVDSLGSLKKQKILNSTLFDTLFEEGAFTEINYLNDSIILFGNFDYLSGSKASIAVILDTNLFNTDSCILAKKMMSEQWTYSADVALGNKPIFLGTLKTGTTKDIQFIKYNSDLSIASYDSGAYTYDSFCPFTPNNTGVVYIGTCDGVVGIEDNDSLDNEGYPSRLRVNPNPVSELAQVSFLNSDHSLNYVLRCYNAFGALVYEENLASGVANHTIDVSNWNAGLYVLTISTKEERLAETKLVVVNQHTRTY